MSSNVVHFRPTSFTLGALDLAINNIFTLIFVVSLAMVSFDYLMAQVTYQEKNDDSQEMDGELELNELLNIICAFLLLVASIIRICVNSFDKSKLGDNSGSKHRLAIIITTRNCEFIILIDSTCSHHVKSTFTSIYRLPSNEDLSLETQPREKWNKFQQLYNRLHVFRFSQSTFVF